MFRESGILQWFGEVAAFSGDTCTDMGNSYFGSIPNSAFMEDLSYLNEDESISSANRLFTYATDPDYYDTEDANSSFTDESPIKAPSVAYTTD